MSDVGEEAAARLHELEAALNAFETTTGPTQAMHACWVQMAADHISWAFEDWFVLADIESVDEDVKRLRQLRREYEEAVRAYSGSAF